VEMNIGLSGLKGVFHIFYKLNFALKHCKLI
jgi:hypothetical protein